jgi:hypothetical protein
VTVLSADCDGGWGAVLGGNDEDGEDAVVGTVG